MKDKNKSRMEQKPRRGHGKARRCIKYFRVKLLDDDLTYEIYKPSVT